ncbi:MAG TPA: amino acid adenylation domain-containing protein [Candidatus Binataceae bacterium]|nr:amino acid adenylation domain-containing protein [Candidatus Binataceae bacterium]
MNDKTSRMPLIHELIEAQAHLTPERKAANFCDRELTYAELLDEVARLSAHLQRQGVGAESVVAICLERSLDMLIAMVAVLHAGGAYLPMDPSFPAERLSFMLADSGAESVVTHSALASRFETSLLKTILIDNRAAWSLTGRFTPTPRPDESSLAYLIYTSGSTGTPKGVMIEHRNLTNFCFAMDDVLGATQPGVWLAVTSISFDISILELLWTLSRGSTVVIQSEEEKLLASGEFGIAAQVKRHGVTHLQCTPSMAEQLIRRPQIVEGLRSLRALLVGGEALPASLAENLARVVSGGVLNMYGPTETTIWSTVARVTPGAPITIGRPIRNTQVYIVDESGRECAAGEVGEICIGGDGVARGYWRREQLTAERFIITGFNRSQPVRLYRTGDLGRFRADRSIDFLGRVDQQVKIRGYRIELGEIEAVLSQHPAVAQAVVVAYGYNDLTQLAAYVVAEQHCVVSAEELRSCASRKLPDFMVPASFTFLAALPTTPNGKIDRKALPPPNSARAAADGESIAPTSLIEGKIAAVLGDALGVANVGINTNFFDLGVTSLIAAEAAVALRATLDLPLKITDLFAHPTVGELARFLARNSSDDAGLSRAGEGSAARLAAMRQRRRAMESAKPET